MTGEHRDMIARDPNVCHGQAVVRGTRIMVSIILDALADGMTEDEIIAEYPTLAPEGIRAAAAYVRCCRWQTTRPSETQTLRVVERLVADTLPPRWSFRSTREAAKGRPRADARGSLKAPDGSAAVYVVQAKRTLRGPQLDQVLARSPSSTAFAS